jgi:hypothetical protein
MDFLFFPSLTGRNPLAAQPTSSCAWLDWPSQPSGCAPVSRSPIRPVKRESDPITLQLDPNPLSYPLSCSFKLILFPFQFFPNLHKIEFDSNYESVIIFVVYDSVQKYIYIVPVLARCRSIGDPITQSQHQVTLLRVAPPPRSLISSPVDRWSSSSMSPKVGASRPASRAILRSPPPFEDPPR